MKRSADYHDGPDLATGGEAWRVALGLGLAMLALAPGCGPQEKASPASPATAAVGSEDSARRATQALTLLRQANTMEYAEKISALRDVAHVFGDTPGGEEAGMHLILTLLDGATADSEAAWRELRSFGRRTPRSLYYLNACEILAGKLRKDIYEDAPGRAVAETLVDGAIKAWVEAARLVAPDAAHVRTFPVQALAGRAEAAAGEFAKAEACWAKIESFDPPATAYERVQALTWRADLLRAKMGDPKAALVLLRRAEALTPELDVKTDGHIGGYIRTTIAELEELLKKGQ